MKYAVATLPVARLPAARLPVARLPIARLPVVVVLIVRRHATALVNSWVYSTCVSFNCLLSSGLGELPDRYYCMCTICPTGDGKLSYREFLAVMKRWKLRGYKVCEIIGGM